MPISDTKNFSSKWNKQIRSQTWSQDHANGFPDKNGQREPNMEGSDGLSWPWDSYREGLEISGPSCCRYSPAIWRLHNASIQREFDRRGPWYINSNTMIIHRLTGHGNLPIKRHLSLGGTIMGQVLRATEVFPHQAKFWVWVSQATHRWERVGAPAIQIQQPLDSLGTTWPKTSQWNPLNPLSNIFRFKIEVFQPSLPENPQIGDTSWKYRKVTLIAET